MARTLALCLTATLLFACKAKNNDATTGPGVVASGSATTAAGSATTAGSAGSAAAAAPTMSPADRTKALLDAQIEAIRAGSDDKLAATLDPAAILLAPRPTEAKQQELARQLGNINPHDTVKDIKVVTSASGGNQDAVWLVAELAITKLSQEPETKEATVTETIRATEFLTAASGWKVVAAAFAHPQDMRRKRDTWSMPAGTPPGPLANLLVAPDQIVAAFSSDPAAAAVGNGEHDLAIGADAAKKLVGAWSAHKLKINAAHEVRDAKAGFVQAMIDIEEGEGRPYRIAGQLFALPKPDGSWQVVAVQYVGL